MSYKQYSSISDELEQCTRDQRARDLLEMHGSFLDGELVAPGHLHMTPVPPADPAPTAPSIAPALSCQDVYSETDELVIGAWLKKLSLTMDILPAGFRTWPYKQRKAALYAIASEANAEKRRVASEAQRLAKRPAFIAKWNLPADYYDRAEDEQKRLYDAARKRASDARAKARHDPAGPAAPTMYTADELLAVETALDLLEPKKPPLSGAERNKAWRNRNREHVKEADRKRKRTIRAENVRDETSLTTVE